MRIFLKYILITTLLFFSGCTSLKNKEYASDFRILDKNKFAQKYYELYSSNEIDFSKVKKEKAYFTFTNNSTFQIIIFSDDGYIYESQLMPVQMLSKKLPSVQLLRGDYFSIKNDVLKIESKVPSSRNISSIIREGQIKNDTIFMKKKYNLRGYKNTRNLFNQYIYDPRFKIYRFGSEYFVE